MRISIKQLKEAFIAECNRASNLSLGRAFFQDFEIAHFLNAAYEICLSKKLAQLDERFVSMDNRQKTPPTTGLPNNYHLLNDLGLLWGGSVATKSTVPATTNDISSTTTKEEDTISYSDLGAYTQHFLIRRDTSNVSPHILNPRIMEADATKVWAVKVLRPITSLDASKLSLVYSDDQYMPYVYYQIRRYGSHLTVDADTGYVKNRLTNMIDDASAGWEDTSSDYLECSYRRVGGSSTDVILNYDYITSPWPITTEEVTDESPRKLEVAFCYEIVLQASQLAMESLGSERSNTLAQINQQTQQ